MSTRSRRKRLQSATLERTKAASDIQTTTTCSFEQIQRNAALAQQVVAERAEAEKRTKAQAERERIAIRQASIDQVEAGAAAKDAAWKQFCQPSPTCANPWRPCADGMRQRLREGKEGV